MSAQQITPELRQWIVDQASAGHGPESVLQSMVASGWHEEVAVQAMEETLAAFLGERGISVSEVLPPQDLHLLEPRRLPEPSLESEPATVFVGDREVQVLLSMQQPRVVVFGGLLAVEECDELVDLAGRRLARSETVKIDTGASEI